MDGHRDSRGYYRTLRLGTDATSEQVQLAYELLEELPDGEREAPMSEVVRAYTVLSDPAARRAYDQMETAPARPQRPARPKARLKVGDARLLVVCGVLLVCILAFVWYPLYGSRFRSFSAGDRLLGPKEAPFGMVVRSEERHAFPNGAFAPAYLVELHGTGRLVWYPASDIAAICRRAD